jgi:Protein of unknown function (DUF3072)
VTALSDALQAAQQRAVAALAKSYLRGHIARDDVIDALLRVGLNDNVEQDEWLAALDVLIVHGAQPPAEQDTKRNGGEPEPATDAQWKYLCSLADDRQQTAPDGPLTKEQASQVIEQLKAGTYDPDAWAVPF